MKMVVGFIIGAVTIFLLMIGLQFVVPVRADETAADSSETILNIMDIEKINREALVTPLREAEKTITDPDIAKYYHTLLERCDIPEEDDTAAVSP